MYYSVKKMKRIKKLCNKKRIKLPKGFVKSREHHDEISEWCDKNLNGSYHWFGGSSWLCENWEIGFQIETDMMAFKMMMW